MTKDERKQVANRLREAVSEAESRSESMAYKYGWLETSIERIASEIAEGRFPKKGGK